MNFCKALDWFDRNSVDSTYCLKKGDFVAFGARL